MKALAWFFLVIQLVVLLMTLKSHFYIYLLLFAINTFFLFFYTKHKYEGNVLFPLKIAFYLGLSILVIAIVFRFLFFFGVFD